MSIGPAEIVIVLILALLVFGPKRLPQMGKSLGKGVREFRKAAETAKTELGLGEVTDQINEVKATFTEPLKGVTDTFSDLKSSVDLKTDIESAGVVTAAITGAGALASATPAAESAPAPAPSSRDRRRRRSRRRRCSPTCRGRRLRPRSPPRKRPREQHRPPPSRRRAPCPPARRRVPRQEPDRVALTAEERLTLFEHLDELRKRLFVCLIAATVGVLVAAIFNSFMFDALLYPLRQVANLPESATKITTFSPAEPFMVSLKVWVVGGLILAAPVIIYELWAFLAPAFTSGEKKYFYPIVFATTALFFMGVALAYFLVLPKGLAFLLTFSAGYFNVQLRASDYFTFMALFVLAFGVVFELPVVLVLLAKVGVVDDKWLRKNRRWAIVALAFAAAIITPSQDAFSMLAMFIPLYVLYEVSIVLARFVQPKREADTAVEDSSGGDDDSASRAPA